MRLDARVHHLGIYLFGTAPRAAFVQINVAVVACISIIIIIDFTFAVEKSFPSRCRLICNGKA
jgi:hypothetical protein